MSASSVNKIFGSVVLDDARDLDFVIDSPLPLTWQRTYVSSNAHVGWLGQGWAVPLSFRLEAVENGIDFIDTQGRRTAFPELRIGESFFSPYEHTTLTRTARNQYELAAPEGLRLLFGPAPSDYAVIAQREAAETARAERLANEIAAFDAQRRERGEPPLQGVSYTPDTAPQVETFALHRLVDANAHWLQVHYTADDRPQVVETSDGRHVGLIFDTEGDDPEAARLRQVLLLHGNPDEHGRFAASSLLIEYRYSEARDLVAVVDDSGATVREFSCQRHMMRSQGEPGGVASQFEWDQLAPDGRVRREAHASGDVHTFHYDRLNRRNSLTDASGRCTVYTYNGGHRYTGYTDAQGASTRFELDAYGQRTATVDALGRVTRYDYDATGNLARITQPDGSHYTLSYTAQRHLASITDPLDRTTRYIYDERGNLIETIQPDGATTRYVLNAAGWPVGITDPLGGKAVLDYDNAGRLVSYRDCVGSLTRYAYDDRGNLLRVVDALDQITHYQYQRINRQDRVVAITTPDGATERFVYDALGRLIAHHDANGAATLYTLAAGGQPLVRENALGHRLRYQYDVHGRLLALTNENGAVYRFAWDKADRLVAELGFDARRQDYHYNAAGELMECVDGVPHDAPLQAPGLPGLLRTRYQRDQLGRLLAKVAVKPLPDGRPAVNTSRYRYDAAGQLIQARNRQARIDLHYTPGGHLAREVMQTRGGQSTALAHTYDGLGNRLATVLPDGRRLESHVYGSGHVDRISLDGETISSFERDRLHRETVRTQGALRSYYERDALGRLRASQTRRDLPLPAHLLAPGGRGAPPTQTGSAAGSTQAEPTIARHYHYDRAGQLLAIDDSRQGRTLYRYDATGRLLAAHARHARETFAFDPASNLLDPDAPPSAQAHAADRTAKRSWTEAEWKAYVRENIANPDFNPLLTPEELAADPRHWGEAKPNRLAVYQEHRYRYDRWGNCVEKKSGAHEVRCFEWDAEHQLQCARITRVERGRFVIEHWGYDYDAFGRRIAKYRLPTAEPVSASAYATHATAQRKRRSADAVRAGYRDAATHFTWDGNRLLLERGKAWQTLYLYEPSSFVPLALVQNGADAVVDEAEHLSLPLEIQSLKDSHPSEWAAAEQRRKKLQRRLDAQLGVAGVSEPLRSRGDVFYVHADHLGTPRELTDADGQLVWTAVYKAWGAATIATPPYRVVHQVGNTLAEAWEEQADPITQNLRFQGQYFDVETALHYNRFRYYDPEIGGFISQDPIGLAGGVNSYQYAPNPVGWVDPFGLAASRSGNRISSSKSKLSDCDRCRIMTERKCDEYFDDFHQAQNRALEITGITAKGSESNPSRFGSTPFNGRRVVGEARGYRVEHDGGPKPNDKKDVVRHGAHINTFDGKKPGKTICFEASKATVEKINRRFRPN